MAEKSELYFQANQDVEQNETYLDPSASLAHCQTNEQKPSPESVDSRNYRGVKTHKRSFLHSEVLRLHRDKNCLVSIAQNHSV